MIHVYSIVNIYCNHFNSLNNGCQFTAAAEFPETFSTVAPVLVEETAAPTTQAAIVAETTEAVAVAETTTAAAPAPGKLSDAYHLYNYPTLTDSLSLPT